MLIAQLTGPLASQLQQYLFAQAAAEFLGTALKLDSSAASGMPLTQAYRLGVETASAAEIAAARTQARLVDDRLGYDAEVWRRLCDGAYLEGDWADFRYARDIVARVRTELIEQPPLTPAASEALAAIAAAPNAVALDLRHRPLLPGQAALGPLYFEDTLAEMRDRFSDARFFVLCDQAEEARRTLGAAADLQLLIASELGLDEAQALALLRRCRHHIVSDSQDSLLAARLRFADDGHVIAPAQRWDVRDAALRARFGSIEQPVYPEGWQIFPTRLPAAQQGAKSAQDFDGGRSRRPLRVGWYSLYERFTTDNYLFKNVQATNGHNLLKPFVDLYDYGQSHGIEFMTLDLAPDLSTLDAIVFTDKVNLEHPRVKAALAAPQLVKILIIYECPLIKPENWDPAYHALFDYVFTWADNLVDGTRYLKSNFSCDFVPTYDVEVLKTTFAQRKLACLVNSSVLPQNPERFPNQLYTHRVKAIRWFEAHAPQDFDLYGMGWKQADFPSYRGKLRDKLAALSHYRFCICYENAMGYPGYITEKVQDCLIAGTVPVYGGAPNIDQWLPRDCYIDIAQFATYEQLHQHLSSMDAQTHAGYLERIRQFLQSEQAYPFRTECWVNTLTQVLAWEVQTRRGEPAELALAQGSRVNGRSHQLLQDRHSLRLSIVPRAVEAAADAANATPRLWPGRQVREELAALRRDELVVCLPWDPEQLLQQRARAVWDLYASHLPGLQLYFVHASDRLPLGDVLTQGRELSIGVAPPPGRAPLTAEQRQIATQLGLYDYLLRNHQQDFVLALLSICSLMDFRGLAALLDVLPRRGLFGGLPGTLREGPYSGVAITHGANTLLSSDLLALLRARHQPGSELERQPLTHWQGVLLRDVPRTALPLFSVEQPRPVGAALTDFETLCARLLQDGHFHFLFQTRPQAGLAGREDVDSWLMLHALETLLRTPVSAERARALQQRCARACDPAEAAARDFPINDAEAAQIYR